MGLHPLGKNDMTPKTSLKTQVMIIGGGVTGTGLARDLALRGIACIIVDQHDINAGASGSNHGLLHSGARYVASDPASARECQMESERLKRLAPQCIEDTGGLFVAVQGDDEAYISDFAKRCEKSGINAAPMDIKDAREMEPALSPEAIAVFAVNDATIDPFKLALDNLSQARQLGTRLLRHHKVTGFHKHLGQIVSAVLINTRTGKQVTIEAEQIVNAAGAWTGQVAALAGAQVQMVYSQGSLLISQSRLSRQVINRLRPPSDGDILAPAGTVSIFGTTSVAIDNPDFCRPTAIEIDAMLTEGIKMLPKLASTRFIRTYAGVRPLVKSDRSSDERLISRGFTLFSHEKERLSNFISITGGKLTTYRLMAEKTADWVAERLGVAKTGSTRIEPLPASNEAQWTEPGLTPKLWLKKKDPSDLLLCECEMVPTSVFNDISQTLAQQGSRASLREIGQRSRVGKGPCQGTFCSLRMTAHMYHQEILQGAEGVKELKDFLNERWRGMQPLLWGSAVAQSELQEAMHCGLFGLEVNEI
jgi:glycerol-3-phosphate dehydrogenase